MTRNTRLELTWIGKENRHRLEPRILMEDQGLSHHAHAKRAGDLFDNLLIQGDNLLALKALQASHAGQVKCVFIDPPYNTGSAFTHYDDGVEHSLWLSLMRDRLEMLKSLLSPDGSIWITIDDNEAHYLKVLCDEVFGRANFIANVVWQKRYSPDVRVALSDAHEHVLCYAMNPDQFKVTRNLIPLGQDQIKQFRNPDNDARGPWKATDFTAAGFRPNQMYEIELPSGRKVTPPAGRCWRVTVEGFERFAADKRMYYGADGQSLPALKRFLSEMEGMTPWSWWPHTEVGHSQEGKKEMHGIFGKEDAFDTPKPERLLQRIIHIATNPGDLVLDSFAGSGTTGAVAHKMGRRWIMVELGEHAKTHIVPRLKKVIDGEDGGGITKAVNWAGGGGFRFCHLAPSLLEKDQWGQWVISKDYNPAMLAQAMCAHMGFTYAPDAQTYWNHGFSSETDFIYVTTAALTHEQLRAISEDVGKGRTLLVCCKAFQGAHVGALKNLTVQKIPTIILNRCEWGRDDYSLRVASLPDAPDLPVEEPVKARGRAADPEQASLFDEGEG
ncbi:site-specific DNA-methyltransferase [Aquidulcibacter sp.]|jgi:adenine-specific DNA-methyltransferase|uniref:site-specific DNA-methyltransferase n=1 Tax=Aquidulcibacter sp. TaxID=2052990 RepID=UPI003BA6EDEF